MINFFLKRPIGVIMSFLAFSIIGIITIFQIPVSLLPDIEAPFISIRTSQPGASSIELEENVLKPIRSAMQTLSGVKQIESTATASEGYVDLIFEHGQNMALNYVLVNERLDHLKDALPENLNKIETFRISPTDIPIFKLEITPQDDRSVLSLSPLIEQNIKRRLEQIEGVTTIDINGLKQVSIFIAFDLAILQSIGIDEVSVLDQINNYNSSLTGLSVKDGQYKYFVKVSSDIKNIEGLQNTPIATENGGYVLLKEMADISLGEEFSLGHHLFNGREAISIAIYQNSTSNSFTLQDEIKHFVERLKVQYPEVQFELTRNQSDLLTSGIQSLVLSLVLGSIFVFIVLFLFTGDYRTPLIISTVLPISISISFLCIYVSKLSINIFSLSGLVIGIGMLIDNAIIISDNITQKRNEGLGLELSCALGIEEVFSALLSSILTTLVVFLPLLFVSHISKVLFFDQSVSLAFVLFISLISSSLLIPLLSKIYLKHSDKPLSDTFIFNQITKFYARTFHWVIDKRLISLGLFSLLTIVFIILMYRQENLSVEILPKLERKNLEIFLDWNEPIDSETNKTRVKEVLRQFKDVVELSQSDVGVSQFIVNQDKLSSSQVLMYFEFRDEQQLKKFKDNLAEFLSIKYSKVKCEFRNPPDAFEQVIPSTAPYLEIRVREDSRGNYRLSSFSKMLSTEGIQVATEGSNIERTVELSLNHVKSHNKKVKYSDLLNKLKLLFQKSDILSLENGSNSIKIRTVIAESSLSQLLQSRTVKSTSGVYYPISEFVTFSFKTIPTHVKADSKGVFTSFFHNNTVQPDYFITATKRIARELGVRIDYAGEYFKQREFLQEFVVIISISILLMLLILIIQFESFLQPLIIIATLPVGFLGSMLMLWVMGESINIMSGIGIIVALGIIVNDSIIKIDTINRSLKSLNILNKSQLLSVIHLASGKRLKPILMTSITTILAVIPILFFNDIGSELQRPLIMSVIGGLTVGTFLSIYIVPVLYYYFIQIERYRHVE